MDEEFDQQLIEIKPYLLNLAHKTERQQCAVWVKKLCEPMTTLNEQKNRNLYCKLLLHMLKQGIVDGPFTDQPKLGPLESLPSYMTLFFDDSKNFISPSRRDNFVASSKNENHRKTPDWAKNELPLTLCQVFPASQGDVSLENFVLPSLENHNEEVNVRNENLSHMHILKDYHQSKTNPNFIEEQNVLLAQEKQMKTKLLEAEFHEERLGLQHKHDIALQKVLNRKNAEIEELKQHYREKEKDYNEIQQRLERKVQSLIKESQYEKENKEKQVEDLTSLLKETSDSLRSEYDEKLHEMAGEMEKEKYELQKKHTKSIQDLLDDTNRRLATMEEEYNSQTLSTKLIVNELEDHVTQLTNEVETTNRANKLVATDKEVVEKEKKKLQVQLDQLNMRYEAALQKLSQTSTELEEKERRCNEQNVDVEHIKEEQVTKAARMNEMMQELEKELEVVRRSLVEAEAKRDEELKIRESSHNSDMQRLQHLHEKYVHSLQREWSQEREDHHRNLESLKESLMEKEEQMRKLSVAQKRSVLEAEQAIEAYKAQASGAQQKVYADMRKQLKKLEDDLQESQSTRTQLQEGFESQMKQRDCEFEKEKKTMVEKWMLERQSLMEECEKRIAETKQRFREVLSQKEKFVDQRSQEHDKVISSLEEQIRTLREELLSANQLRRQQLVELGLLREEERQKASRDHQIAISKLESDMDKQRMDLHRHHASEMEDHTLKMKVQVERLENDYRQQLDRAQERMEEAQLKESSLRSALEKRNEEMEDKLRNSTARVEDEKQSLMTKYTSLVTESQATIEKLREDCRLKDRQLQNVHFDFRNELSRVKLDCEERLKGMIPKSLKLDLEDTIDSLHSQVKSLQQRIEILQVGDSTTRLSPLRL